MENNYREYIEEYLGSTRFGLVDLIVRGEKRSKVIEVYIDDKENISIDDLTHVNKDLNEIFDAKGLSVDLSKIVVSSPGAEKPFRYHWQLHKHKGRTLQLIMNSDEELTGRLSEVNDDNSIVIEPLVKNKKKNEEPAGPRIIGFDDIKECKVKLKF